MSLESTASPIDLPPSWLDRMAAVALYTVTWPSIPIAVKLVDVDRDGDLDVLVAGRESRNLV